METVNTRDSIKNTLTFGDAQKIAGPLAFNIMLKPAGSLCNLDCNYCYYLDKADIYDGKEPRMSYEMLEKVIREYIEANEVPQVCFNWHGGEPLVLGIDFYRKALELEKKYGQGKEILNTIQTNGTLVNAQWAQFFRENNFLVGISIDGPEDIHNRFRKDKGGAPTFDKVMRAIELFRLYGVEFNTMTTVNRASEGRGLEVYQFLKSIGSRYMQFMPVVEHVVYPVSPSGKVMKSARPHIVAPDTPGAVIAPWCVHDVEYGKFLCSIFDYWVRNDVGQYFVGQFDATLACWCGVQPGTCVFGQTCGGNSVIEHNGDLYPCDHFVYPGMKLGNIAEKSIREMMESPAQVKFGIDKRNSLPTRCLRCEFLFACNGECPKHRFNTTEKGETGLNALCYGYKMFYSHAAPYMDKMKELLLQEKSPALVMQWAKA